MAPCWILLRPTEFQKVRGRENILSIFLRDILLCTFRIASLLCLFQSYPPGVRARESPKSVTYDYYCISPMFFDRGPFSSLVVLLLSRVIHHHPIQLHKQINNNNRSNKKNNKKRQHPAQT